MRRIQVIQSIRAVTTRKLAHFANWIYTLSLKCKLKRHD